MAKAKPKKPAPRRKAKRATARSPRSAAPQPPLLETADVRRILLESTVRLAPADIVTLMGHEADLRQRTAELNSPALSLFRDQLILALDFLRDHLDGDCPQIPYYTVALLGSAVFYFADTFDVIPDSIPRIGQLDDAAVMAMACHLGAEGLRRYCTWKGRPAAPIDDHPRFNA